MKPVELRNKIYWVGAVDYDVRDFHGYVTPGGTTYNAYLIVDEKIVLVDAVKKGFAKDLLSHVAVLADPSKIDYLVVNHGEPDHSGAVVDVLKAAPRAKIVCTPKAKEFLEKHYGIAGREYMLVKTGDTLKIGQKTLAFVAAPMIHWPDSMFTYVVEDRVLLSNDGFGQHLASPHRFADEVGEEICFEEAAKYYANILMPLGTVISKKLEELAALPWPVDMIGPSHGAIWRRDVRRIIECYKGWSAFAAGPKVTIIFDTMWEATDTLARRLAELIAAEGVEVKIYQVRKSDGSQIVRDVLDSRILLIGSPTLNADMFWSVGGFLTYLRGLRPKNKEIGIFGSYGWNEAASKAIRKEADAMGLRVIEPPFEVQFTPTEEEMKKLEEYALLVAKTAKGF